MSEISKRHSLFRIFLIAFAVSLVLRLPTLWVHVIDVDEAIWATFAKVLLEGLTPYVDYFDNKPIGVIAFMALVFKAAGSVNLIYVHAVTILIVVATACVLFKIADTLSSQRAGLITSLLYVVFITNYIPKVISTNIETLMNLPLSLAMLALITSYKKNASGNLFMTGFWIALACCFKYQAGIVAVLAGIVILVKPPRKIIADLPCFILGIFPPVIAHVIYLYYFGEESLRAFVKWTLTSSVSYIDAGNTALINAKRVTIRIGTYILATLPLWIFAAIRIRRRSADGIIFGWLIVSFIAALVGWRLYGHYFLLILPPLTILAAQQMDLIQKRSVRVITIISIAIITSGFAIPRYNFDWVNKKTGEDNPFDYIPIAAAVAEKTAPADRIFVWGYAPAIYYFSDRIPATRFPNCDYLTGRTSLPGKISEVSVEKFVKSEDWGIWINDMEQNKPAYIIDTAPAKLHDYENYPIRDYPVIKGYIDKFYEFDTDVNGAILYRRKG